MKKLLQFLFLFKNPSKALLDRLSLIKQPEVLHTLWNGLKFWCRPGSSDLMSVFDIFTSQKHSDYLSQFKIKPGDIVIDIGANVGVFSIQAAKAGGFVSAYEPIADSCRILRQNVNENNLKHRIDSYQVGVDSHARERKIFIGNRNHSMSCSFFEHENTSADSITIRTIEFADILSLHENINLLKIDCEGAEFEFLPNSNLSNVEKIVLEYHEIAEGFHHEKLVSEFKNQGFNIKVKPWKPNFGIIYAWR